MEQWTALFPPGKGGGKGVDYGYKGKGILIHTLTEGNGMPVANRTTPANSSESEQVLPLIDSIKLRNGKLEFRLREIAQARNEAEQISKISS